MLSGVHPCHGRGQRDRTRRWVPRQDAESGSIDDDGNGNVVKFTDPDGVRRTGQTEVTRGDESNANATSMS